mgnify:CR=1 FL=1
MKDFSHRRMLKSDSRPLWQFEFAVNQNDIWMIRYLILSNKVNLNIADEGGDPYWFALVRRVPCPAPQLIGLIRLAVIHGADIHARDSLGRNILEIVARYLQEGCMIKGHSYEDERTFRFASSIPVLEFLLTEFKFSNEEMLEVLVSQYSYTEWDMKYRLNHLKLFLDHGLQLNASDALKLFCLAVDANDIKSADFLREKYQIPVRICKTSGNTHVQFLTDFSAKPQQETNDNKTN